MLRALPMFLVNVVVRFGLFGLAFWLIQGIAATDLVAAWIGALTLAGIAVDPGVMALAWLARQMVKELESQGRPVGRMSSFKRASITPHRKGKT